MTEIAWAGNLTPVERAPDAGSGSIGALVMETLHRIQIKDRQLREMLAVSKQRSDVASVLQQQLEILNRIKMAGDQRNREGCASASELQDAGLIPADEDISDNDVTLRRFTDRLERDYGIELEIHHSDDDDSIELSTLESAINATNARINRMNSGSDLDMINIQSVIESRSNENRLITSVMQAENDVTAAIIGNIG